MTIFSIPSGEKKARASDMVCEAGAYWPLLAAGKRARSTLCMWVSQVPLGRRPARAERVDGEGPLVCDILVIVVVVILEDMGNDLGCGLRIASPVARSGVPENGIFISPIASDHFLKLPECESCAMGSRSAHMSKH